MGRIIASSAMNWIKKAETFLEQIDQKAASKLSNTPTKEEAASRPLSKEQVQQMGFSPEDLGLDLDSTLEEDEEIETINVDDELSQPDLSTHISSEVDGSQSKRESFEENQEDFSPESTQSELSRTQSTESLSSMKESQTNLIDRDLQTNLQAQLQVEKSKVISLEKRLTQANERCNKAKKIIENQKPTLISLLKDKQLREESFEKLNHELEQLRLALKTKNQAYSQLENEFSKVNQERESMQQENIQLTADIEQYRKQEMDSAKKNQKQQSSSQERLDVLQNTIDRHEQTIENLQQSKEEIVNRLEAQLDEMTQSFQETQVNATRLQQTNQTLLNELSTHKRLREAAEQKFKEFKTTHAVVIHELQAKLASYEQNTEGSDSAEQISQLIKEREQVRSELQRAEERINDLNQSIMEYESHTSEAHARLVESVETTTEKLNSQIEQNKTLQSELATRSKQVDAFRERFEQLDAMSSSALKEKDLEIDRLTKRLRSKPITSSTEELERQLQQMTANIEQKQVQIDTLSSENATLHHQLQRALSRDESHHHSKVDSIFSHSQRSIDSDLESSRRYDDEDKVGDRITPMMALAPSLALSNSIVGKSLNHLSSGLDKMAVYCSTTLRTNPGMRLVTIIYLLFLHLWMFSSLLFSGDVGVDEFQQVTNNNN